MTSDRCERRGMAGKDDRQSRSAHQPASHPSNHHVPSSSSSSSSPITHSSTMPKLRISARSTPNSTPTIMSPNSAQPTRVESELFEGDILVRIKDFRGESGDGIERPMPEGEEPYFQGDRQGKTWSICVRGRWKEEIDGRFECPLTNPYVGFHCNTDPVAPCVWGDASCGRLSSPST